MIWLALTLALDAVATTSSRLSEGFTRPRWAALTVLAYVGVLVSFSQAIRALPIGSAYAIWSGLGTAVIATIGVVAFDDRIRPPTLAGIGLIVIGVVILNLGGIRTG